MAVIEVQQLCKTFRVFDRRPGLGGAVKDLVSRRYRSLEAVKDVSFVVDEGDMVGYIGANGAGKSTTIKMLMGILHPTSGEVRIDGLVPQRQRYRYLRRAGVVFGQRTQLWWDLAVQESFRLLQRIYDVSEPDYDARMARFDEVLEIGKLLRTPVRKLSLGQKMRCEVAAALLHAPKVVFLDEPTIGLDVEAKVAIRDFLREINRQNRTTFLLTTHDLKDIEALCPRVMILDGGQLVFDGELSRLRTSLGHETRLLFHLDPGASECDAHGTGQPIAERLGTGADVEWDCAEGNVLCATFSTDRIGRADVIRRVMDIGKVLDITMEEPSIEDVIRKVYREGKVAAGAR